MKTYDMKIPHHGRTVDAAVFVPDGDGVFPFVIISHGYNGHGRYHEGMARALADAGLGVVTYTFCGGSTQDKSGFGTESMTIFTECEDLDAVIDAVVQLPCSDSGRIMLYGESQGGLVTALTAAGRPDDIGAVALLYPAFCIPDNWCDRFPDKADIPGSVEFWGMRLGRNFFVTLRDIDVWGSIGEFRGPVLIMQGTDDPVVPVSYSLRAAEIYKNARLEIFDGEGHGFSPEASRRMTDMTAAFAQAVFGL